MAVNTVDFQNDLPSPFDAAALERGVRGRTTANRIVYRLSVVQPLAGFACDSCRSWNVVRLRLAATLRGPPATPSFYYCLLRSRVFIVILVCAIVFVVCTMSTMDHSILGPSGNASEATRIEIQPENLGDVDVKDPVQRAVDDVSDEESDDGSSVNDADEDPDIYTTAPQWTIATSGMRPIQFTRTDTLLVPIPGNGQPIDWFNMLFYIVFFYNICKTTNKYAFEVLFKPDLSLKSRINNWVELTVPTGIAYRSDNARCCKVHRRLMTLMGQNAHQEFGFMILMPFPDISTHKEGFSNITFF
ncbi:hypothetical protein J6590_015183 [Homalodisca vitripennis]|nr:hypothetical protein J6590_015183 [Homalodisca vitripennis]